MRKKLNYTVPFLFALLIAVGMLVGFHFQTTGAPRQGGLFSVFDEVMQRVNHDYVDQPDDKKLEQAAIDGMLKDLDPHSVFIPAEEVKESNQELEGNFEGIGVEFNILNDTIIVVSPISGGPSEQLGIRAGDRIIKIDDKKVAGVGFKNEDVFKSLRGPKGTKVKVAIYRAGNPKLIDFTITRDKIPIYSVDASYMAAPDVGYIKINRFGGTTLEEYATAFEKLHKQGMKNMILDLRGNPGGYLKSAIDLADQFLGKNKLVLYTQGRARPKETYNSTAMGNFESGKLVVLIDEGSASASEIVSGALQDWDRAVIIGRRSFGKGLVQEPFMLSDGSALRLTVARYYTPSGRCIQRSYKKGVDDYYEDISRRFQHGELISKDSIKLADTVKYYTANHRVVYSGGGIIPDIFVPIDTGENSVYLQKLLNKAVFTEFVIDYVDRHRSNFNKKYPDFQAFNKNFNVDNSIMDEFITYGEKQGVAKDEKGLKVSGPFIKTELKALFARQLFHNDGYFEVLNQDNKAYQKALQALHDGTFDKLGISYK
jgi:carboxyl-terminal processing protease